MKHCHIIIRFLFPSDENTSEPIKPAMSAFNDPTSSLFTRFTLDISRFIASTPHMKRVLEFYGKFLYFITHVTCIKTEMLAMVRYNFRTRNWNTFQCRSNQLYVMPISSVYGETYWKSMLIGQYTAFNAELSAICWIFARLFFPQVEISSLLHPSIAISSLFQFFRHRARALLSRALGKLQLPSILETASERSKKNKCQLHLTHSIGSLSC